MGWTGTVKQGHEGSTPGLGKQQKNKSMRFDFLLRRSRLTIAGNTRSIAPKLNKARTAAWSENTLKAGIGMSAAAKKVNIIHKEVVNTLRPVFLRTTPVCS